MAKAFSDREKEEIRDRLLEEGVRLFHENGSRSLSIRELTARAGISPGSFYHFFSDKRELVLEIAAYRSRQKITAVLERLREETADPAGVLIRLLTALFADMARKFNEKQMYRDMLRLLTESKNAEPAGGAYDAYLKQAAEILAQKDPPLVMDLEGMRNLLAAAALLMADRDRLKEPYGSQLIGLLLENGIRRYVTVEKEHEEHE